MSQQYQNTGRQTGQTAQPYGQGSQQFQPTQGTSGMGQPTGQSMGQQTQGMGQQQLGGGFHATLPTEFRTALEDFAKVTQIAEWCADKCIEEGPQMAECARACEDLADLAELNEKLIARDSIFGPQVAEAYLQVTQQALPILQQFEQSPHVGETLSAVTRSIDSIEYLLSTIGYQPTTGTGGGMGQQGFGQQTQGMSQQFPTGQGSFQQGTY
jgi:hypothetical protein